jgi:hypothetical protein
VQELEITWRRVISIAWLIVWRGAIGGLLLGALIGGIIGFIIGIVGAVMHAQRDQVAPIVTIITGTGGAVFGLFWYCVVVRMALRKRFNGFRLALVSIEDRRW